MAENTKEMASQIVRDTKEYFATHVPGLFVFYLVSVLQPQYSVGLNDINYFIMGSSCVIFCLLNQGFPNTNTNYKYRLI